MASNIFNTNKPVKHVGRNGFDLSSQHVFDMRPSVIRPVIFQHTVPNSSYRINCADLVRTGALQTAAFLRGKQELDFYFVPYSQLFSLSNEIIYGRGELSSVLLDSLQNESFRTVRLGDLVKLACFPYFVRICYDICAEHFAYSGIQPFSIIFSEFPSSYYDSFVHSIFYDYYVNDYASRLNWIGADILHLLSSLGYGDYLVWFDGFFRNYMKTYSYGTDFVSSFKGLVLGFDRLIKEFIIAYVDRNFDREAKYVNPFNLFAYQKIWHDNYRDSVNDNDNELYVYAYSMDYDYRESFMFDITDLFSNPIYLNPLVTILRPRLSTFRKDISTGLYSSSQYGSISILPDLSSENYPEFYSSQNADSENSFSSAQVNPTSAVNIRFTLAMQRYKETLLRAGNRTKDLLMSEFGVKSHYVNDTYSHYLGGFDGALDLNKVSATADTGEYNVGDLAGNVFSSLSGNTIEFTCNDHGIIIGVMRFLTDPLHSAFGISPFVLKSSQFDFYHSEFDNLGLQPISSSIFSPAYSGTNELVTIPDTLGFGVRYAEYKQNIDFAHDSFCGSPVHIVSPGSAPAFPAGANTNYVTLRNVEQTLSDIKYRSYMLPNVMDSIFKMTDSGRISDYQFQVTLDCQISAVLPMSVLGL